MDPENVENVPVISVSRRCNECDKSYTTRGIGAELLSDCPGGICESCGKPALLDFAKQYLSLPRLVENGNGRCYASPCR